MKNKIVILGAGLAGLSAAYELTRNGVEEIVVVEKNPYVGGLATSVERNGFTFDLGGHRFFSKNKEVVDLVKELMGEELLLVNRRSKIFRGGKFYYYPLKLENAISTMGVNEIYRLLISFLHAKIKARLRSSHLETFEDWVVNRFGRKIYELFFKEYTEKAWGLPCTEISADFASQRIAGLSISQMVKKIFSNSNSDDQPRTLISHFYYPAEGGIHRISDKLAQNIKNGDNEILLGSEVVEVKHSNDRIRSLAILQEGSKVEIECDHMISSIPITTLASSMNPPIPQDVQDAVSQLRFRDLCLVFLLLAKPKVTDDTWIYFPEKAIPFTRLHEPKNWSTAMTPDGKTSLCLEFLCSKGDETWRQSDEKIAASGITELVRLGFIKEEEVEDFRVFRVTHAYPVYKIGYDRNLNTIFEYFKKFENLELIGRSGIFRYNNMDHSIEIGLVAARNFFGKKQDSHKVAIKGEYFESGKLK